MQPYHHDLSLQPIQPYTPQFQVAAADHQRPFLPHQQQPPQEQTPHWQQLAPMQQQHHTPSPQPQAQPFFTQPFVQSEAHAVSAALSWSALEHSGKDLLTATEGLSLHPDAINPAHLYVPARTLGLPEVSTIARATGPGDRHLFNDNDSVEGTDDDEARLQLSDQAYLSSTPPLSPNISDHHRLHRMSQHGGLFQSLVGLSNALHPTPGLSDDGHEHDSEYDERPLEDPSEDYDQDAEDEEGEGVAGGAGVEEEERLFQCQQCQKRFLRQYNLNAHLKTHSAERAHNCDQCPKSFLRPYDLSRHQRIHSKDKPYSCKICSMIFIRNDAIWRHYRKVHQGHPDVPTSRREKKHSINPCLLYY
ncbi:hypothetical protein BGZ75_008715 [Mortierella antarctica]|nr:hypothetical protein BGZ75_008715 [Mortierella antarctica]